ncbi:hypothetical protein Golob_020958, partial [Gossypium lobatum]|nr:hypothetical protein [Gossypium lobatum]
LWTENESIFKFEVRAILEGLKLAWELGFRQLEVESDNALVVEMLLSRGAANSNMSELCLVDQLMCRNWKIRFRYIPQYHNIVVDSLAKTAGFNCNEL